MAGGPQLGQDQFACMLCSVMDVYRDKIFVGALLVGRVLELWERGGGGVVGGDRWSKISDVN